MRLFKVRTKADLIITSKTLFGRLKTCSCYVTWNEKYIYAKNVDEAKKKYNDYFFSPAENGYTELQLMIRHLDYCTKSSNMKFSLHFNEKITHTNEYIVVYEEPVTDNIEVIKRNSIADDFRDWFINGSSEKVTLNESDWLHK